MTEYDPNENYPPIGTPEECLVLVINSENFEVLGHAGRFFHAQIGCVGYNGEEIGIDDVPDKHGYWVMENGSVWTSTDYDSGVVDDCGISGHWRPATAADFERFGVSLPAGWPA